jgi:hypothetical protein
MIVKKKKKARNRSFPVYVGGYVRVEGEKGRVKERQVSLLLSLRPLRWELKASPFPGACSLFFFYVFLLSFGSEAAATILPW